jgi:hypothetical protein
MFSQALLMLHVTFSGQFRGTHITMACMRQQLTKSLCHATLHWEQKRFLQAGQSTGSSGLASSSCISMLHAGLGQ